MHNKIKKIINLILLLLVFDIVCVFNIAGAENTDSSSINIKYQDGLLDVNIKKAGLKGIFEEMGKSTGVKFILEKELKDEVITINFKEKELLQGVEDIIKEIGDLGYLVFYNKKDNSIASIYIKGQSEEEETINDSSAKDEDISKLVARVNDLEQLVKDMKKDSEKNIVVTETPAVAGQEIQEKKTETQIDKNDWGINEGEIYSYVEIRIKTVTIDHFENKKPAVKMDHKKHSEALKIECQKCHHKKKEGEKAKQTKCSDKVCHAMVQKKDGKIYDASGSSAELNPYHVTCINCHKKYKDDNKKEAPTKCEGCHKKNRKRD